MSNIRHFEFDRPIQNQQPAFNIEKIFPDFSIKSFTFIITVSQIAIYLVTLGFSLSAEPTICTLYAFGAKYTPSIVLKGQVWRLVLPILLHANTLHILFNAFFQLRIGFAVEKYYQTYKFILIYIISGIGGNIFSAYWDSQNVSVGASTSLFGVFANFGCYYAYNWHKFGPGRDFNLLVYAIIVAISFGSAYDTPNIDIAGHIGGFISGSLLGFALIPREESERRWCYIIYGSFIGVIIYFTVLALMVFNMEFPICEQYICDPCSGTK
ncbi:ROM1_1 [Blepharisma stoltei]|uniref:Rhomboid-like protease n=1 Tax=Blepharisma stoltei TaxID=1481888 RepID=A0AAU9IYB7_9CILI|nr:unnamed protein product [Blepharisma stoltei]